MGIGYSLERRAGGLSMKQGEEDRELEVMEECLAVCACDSSLASG
jgi:hypothetical protein